MIRLACPKLSHSISAVEIILRASSWHTVPDFEHLRPKRGAARSWNWATLSYMLGRYPLRFVNLEKRTTRWSIFTTDFLLQSTHHDPVSTRCPRDDCEFTGPLLRLKEGFQPISTPFPRYVELMTKISSTITLAT
ncbi:hypothetical protein BOTCAL_1115g00020 [Botryotinia calthae]|uniref:Uncharacterized protein n=1 Tax=Botryotinia calthae TaxID=38488 RepID=A0A4Y8CG69_9HELO|nr:hypothetical protein BOTCAL_1115g00020 [Botryotinia calthae]